MPSGSADIPSYTPLNISGVQTAAQNQATQNIAGGIGLEQQYAPGLATATTEYQNLLNSDISQLPGLESNIQGVTGTLGNNISGYTPPTLTLPALGANPVQGTTNNLVAQQVNQGGNLNQDVANATQRTSAQTAGQAGVLGSVGAQGQAAANLGNTALTQLNQNLSTGNTVAGQEQNLNLAQQAAQSQIQSAQAQLQQANMAQQSNTANSLNSLLSPYLNAMGEVGNTPLPTAGLSPTDTASLEVGLNTANNQNTANDAALQQQATNNMWNFYGGIADAAASLAGKAAMAAA